MRTLATYLVEILHANGVEMVFGIPGVHTVELYRGLGNSAIRHVTPRHEQGAGFMADGYARVTGKPGVCFIITGPGMTNIATAMGQAHADSIPMLVISTVNSPGADAIEEAASRLSVATRPLIVAGGGAKHGAASIRELAHRLNAPVMMTVNGRGILAGDDPLALPFSGEAPGVAGLICDADVILALGTELGPTDFWGTLPSRAQVDGWLIRVDLDPESVMRGILPDQPILADAAATAAGLAGHVQETRTAAENWGAMRVEKLRKSAVASMRPAFAAGLAAMDEIARAQPDTIIVGDSCQPAYAGCMAFGAPKPGSWFCSSTGFGTLGYGLPAAIGAALGAPDRPVCGLIGDGGIQFTLAELGSATEAGTAMRMILWNNQGYQEIKRFMMECGIAPLGVDIFTPDFQAILAAYGWRYHRAGDLASLRELLAAPAESNELIEIDEATFVASLNKMDNPD